MSSSDGMSVVSAAPMPIAALPAFSRKSPVALTNSADGVALSTLPAPIVVFVPPNVPSVMQFVTVALAPGRPAERVRIANESTVLGEYRD